MANHSCVGIAFWGDASADLGAGLPGAIKKGQIHRLVCQLCPQRHQQRSPTLHKPPGQGRRGLLPQEQTKRGGSRRPCRYLTTVGTGCSQMRNGGRAQRNCIASGCWHMWWSTAGAFLGGSEGLGGRKSVMQGCKTHGTLGVITGR